MLQILMCPMDKLTVFPGLFASTVALMATSTSTKVRKTRPCSIDLNLPYGESRSPLENIWGL